MMRTFKYSVLLATTLLMAGSHSYAVGQDEEAKLILRHNQIRRNFVNSRAELLNELDQIDNLAGDEKLKKLREFANKNLNIREKNTKKGLMSSFFARFVKDPNYMADATSLEQKIRNALTEDLNDLANTAPSAHLPGGNFPVGHWKPHQSVQPTTEVQITHGGGLNYLLNCFEEKEVGYKLERGGAGLQVHPYCDGAELSKAMAQERPPQYAYNSMSCSLDFPAVLTGTIQAQYLMPADHVFEAAISVSDLKHIKNAKLTLVTSDVMKNSLGWMHEFHTKEFCKLLPQSLHDRLNAFNARHYDALQPAPLWPKVPVVPPAPPPTNPKKDTAPVAAPSRPVLTATKKAATRQHVTKQKAHKIASRPTALQPKVLVASPSQPISTATKKATTNRHVTKQKTPRKATRKAASHERISKQKVAGTSTRKATSRQRVVRQKLARKTTRKAPSRQRVTRKKTTRRR